jgi:uncharacterized protein (AIM24 family)
MFEPDFLGCVTVLDSAQGKNTHFEVIEYDKVYGVYDTKTYTPKSFINKLRQVRIKLSNNATIVTEAGALQFLKGNIEMKTDSSAAGLVRGIFSSALTAESAVKPTYTGSGELYLEPSYKNYILFVLDNEEVVVDKGIFYCCESSINVGIFKNDTIAGLVSGEGMFQTKLSGSGVCVIESPVTEHELLIYQLNNDILRVDGNYAILRRGNITFTVEKSSKSILSSIKSGEGLLYVYRGVGEVWLVPGQHFARTSAWGTPGA